MISLILLGKISNKVTKGKFKLVDGFQLKCPDGFVQQGTHCGRLIEISNSEENPPQKIPIVFIN